jgi:mercuric ion transport protein
MQTSSSESSKKGLYAALAGVVLVLLCCFTPILVGLLAAVGLSAFTRHLDYVLWPALVIFVVLAMIAYRKWKAHSQA